MMVLNAVTRITTVTFLATLFAALAVPARLAAQHKRDIKHATFITFDAPGASATLAFSINPAGAITGYYLDASFAFHGFLRGRDGTFTTFDAPGGGNINVVRSINPAGMIAGDYSDTSSVSHGFLRAPDGTFTSFDAPGCCINANSINPAGVVTGYYFDASDVTRSFVRIPNSR
jgi:hypothetical protein